MAAALRHLRARHHLTRRTLRTLRRRPTTPKGLEPMTRRMESLPPMKPKEITVPIRFTFDINGEPVDAMDALSRTIIEENDRLTQENKDLLHKVEVLTLQERTQRQRGDQWHAKWSAQERIMSAVGDGMSDATRRLHALFGEDLTWDELLWAATDELESRAETPRKAPVEGPSLIEHLDIT